MSRPVDQIREAQAGFVGCRTPTALIGGLALASTGSTLAADAALLRRSSKELLDELLAEIDAEAE